MGLFSNDNIVDKLYNGADKLVLTDEEKTDYWIKAKEWYLNSLKDYVPFKLAQRYLALWFSFLFGLAFIISLCFVLADKDIKPIIEVVEAFNLGWIVFSIVSWYFLGGVLPQTNETVKKILKRG